MGKRSSSKSRAARTENQVQAAITTLHRHGWEVALQDGETEGTTENPAVVRAIIISPWQPKEIADNQTYGYLPEGVKDDVDLA
jgi:hypothetical protein